MRNRRWFGVAGAGLIAFFLVFPNDARAQRMGHVGAMRTFSAPVRTAPIGMHVTATHPVTNQTIGTIRTTGQFRHPADSFGLGGAAPTSLQDLLNPVPGLGFDYSHLAAINSDLGIKAVIDPATEWRLAVAERLLRDERGFSGTGYYLLDGGGSYVVPVEAAAPAQAPQQAPIIVVQQAPPAAQVSAPPAPAAAAQPAPPLPDVGQFTLVLKNGKKIQAVAFTRQNGRIVYITADGSRRTIAASELNIRATEQLNEERGTRLQLGS